MSSSSIEVVPGDAEGAKVKERSERRWRGGAVRAVKSQGGGAVARWRSVRVSGRRWASMDPTHLAWMWVGKEADADDDAATTRLRRRCKNSYPAASRFFGLGQPGSCSVK